MRASFPGGPERDGVQHSTAGWRSAGRGWAFLVLGTGTWGRAAYQFFPTDTTPNHGRTVSVRWGVEDQGG